MLIVSQTAKIPAPHPRRACPSGMMIGSHHTKHNNSHLALLFLLFTPLFDIFDRTRMTVPQQAGMRSSV
jgi:hypothetical protein